MGGKPVGYQQSMALDLKTGLPWNKPSGQNRTWTRGVWITSPAPCNAAFPSLATLETQTWLLLSPLEHIHKFWALIVIRKLPVHAATLYICKANEPKYGQHLITPDKHKYNVNQIDDKNKRTANWMILYFMYRSRNGQQSICKTKRTISFLSESSWACNRAI